jgi:UDP-N-acetylmuramate--alanine ligase
MTMAGRIYMVGIGGIGMSALARYYKSQGFAVMGSDSAESRNSVSLRKDAIKVKIGHKKGNLKHFGDTLPDLVIYNRAIPADNPELIAAQTAGIRTIPYAEALGELTELFSTIAITGSHGKSTTTAFAALALIRAGLDPTVLIGTNLKEFGGKNIRIGNLASKKEKYLILEADDFGAAFWSYSPSISIITNIDREHLDFYKNLAGVKQAFLKFIERTIPGGAVILNQDDENLFSLKREIAAIVRTKHLRIIWYSTHTSPSARRTALKIKKVLKLPGEHNLSNAMAVYQLGRLLKLNEKKILDALGSYRGAWRRMEYRGEMKTPHTRVPVKVYDDYAHHPTEIEATLEAFREKFPHREIVCVFQPHQSKRLEMLFKEFAAAFTGANILVLIPSYIVAGRDEKNSKFTSERLAHAIAKKHPHQKIYYLANPRRIKKSLTKIIALPAIIIMMGAGDIVRYTDLLFK